MFIRVKKVKQYHYAYLVENKWKKGKASSRQKVKQYLGRVHKLESNGKGFEDDISEIDFKEIVMKLAEFELLKNGFEKHGTGNKYLREGFFVDLDDMKFEKDEKSVVFEMNEGFLCEFTLAKLLKFKARGHEEEVGYALANAILEAGLAVPQELFVKIFEKVYKKDLVSHL